MVTEWSFSTPSQIFIFFIPNNWILAQSVLMWEAKFDASAKAADTDVETNLDVKSPTCDPTTRTTMAQCADCSPALDTSVTVKCPLDLLSATHFMFSLAHSELHIAS